MTKPPEADDLTTETDAHVQIIAREMCSGRWRTGLSHEQWAKAWGKPLRYVIDRAGEAGRFIRLTVGDRKDEIIGSVVAELEALVAMAKQDRKVGEACKAIELRCRLLRLVDDGHSKGQIQVSNFGSAKEALSWIEGLLPELRAQAAQEPAKLAGGKTDG